MCVPLSSRRISGIVLFGLGVCSSSLQFRLAGQKGSDATASNPHDLRYSKLHFKLESAEVKSSGKGFFPYVLRDNAFHIQLSRSRSIPFAYVQLSSQYLTFKALLDAEKSLHHVLKKLGTIAESANVSRIDLFVDFVTSENMESWNRHAWVTRAAAINTYSVEREFSGWMIGAGGVISCRLYNKTLEIKQSRKAYLLELWHKAG